MKWLKWSFILAFLLVLLIPLIIFGLFKINNDKLEKETYSYLIDKGYEDSDIESVNSTYKKLSRFTAEVVFVNEPEVTYDYKKDGDRIIQLGPTIRKDNYEYKHLEPYND